MLLALIIAFAGGAVFFRQVSQFRGHAWAGPRTAAQKQRRPAKPRSVRQESRLAWQKVKATDWLEQQRHARKTGTVIPFSGRQPHHPSPPQAPPASHAAGTLAPPAQQGSRRRGGGLFAAVPPQAPPARPPATPPPSDGSSGRNTTVASTGSNAVEQFVEGVNQIHAQAQAGGIHAKHAAVKACHEACVRFAAMAAMLARQMSEPGQNYGNEITEPIAKSATQLQASAMTFSEADSALTTLENMTVGELAASSRQAPHHAELSENGSR